MLGLAFVPYIIMVTSVFAIPVFRIARRRRAKVWSARNSRVCCGRCNAPIGMNSFLFEGNYVCPGCAESLRNNATHVFRWWLFVSVWAVLGAGVAVFDAVVLDDEWLRWARLIPFTLPVVVLPWMGSRSLQRLKRLNRLEENEASQIRSDQGIFETRANNDGDGVALQRGCADLPSYNWTFAAAARCARLARRTWAARHSTTGPDGTCLRSIAASLRSPLNRTGTSANAERYVKAIPNS